MAEIQGRRESLRIGANCCYNRLSMNRFLIHSLRIISGVVLPLGTLFLGSILVSIVQDDMSLTNNIQSLYAVLAGFGIVVLTFVIPLLVLLFLDPKNEYHKAETLPATSHSTDALIGRPIRRNLIFITLLIIVGLIPLTFIIFMTLIPAGD